MKYSDLKQQFKKWKASFLYNHYFQEEKYAAT